MPLCPRQNTSSGPIGIAIQCYYKGGRSGVESTSRRARIEGVGLSNVNFGPKTRPSLSSRLVPLLIYTVALLLAEILNVIQVFSPAQAVLFVTVVTVVNTKHSLCCSAATASRKCQKTRVNPENTDDNRCEAPGEYSCQAYACTKRAT